MKLYDAMQKAEKEVASPKPVVVQEPEAVIRAPVTPAEVTFTQTLPKVLVARLELERAKRGLRSRSETIRVLLGEALSK